MITSLDTSVILDILIDNPGFARSSELAIRRARLEGKIIICECVLAEIIPALGNLAVVDDLLSDWQIAGPGQGLLPELFYRAKSLGFFTNVITGFQMPGIPD